MEKIQVNAQKSQVYPIGVVAQTAQLIIQISRWRLIAHTQAFKLFSSGGLGDISRLNDGCLQITAQVFI